MMKKYIFISNEGQTLAPDVEVEVNNMQVIGIMEDVKDEEEALRKLLNEKPWIWQAGYNVDEFVVYEIK